MISPAWPMNSVLYLERNGFSIHRKTLPHTPMMVSCPSSNPRGSSCPRPPKKLRRSCVSPTGRGFPLFREAQDQRLRKLGGEKGRDDARLSPHGQDPGDRP